MANPEGRELPIEVPACDEGGLVLRKRRMDVGERDRHIVSSAIQFFATHGLGGQLRDLAKSMGIAHTLLYHYYPTKQALLDRVYKEVFEDRWRPQWEVLLDDKKLTPHAKLFAFYQDYTENILTREFVRILVFSGLTDHTITDRFFQMLRGKLFPRIIRETRLHRGLRSRAKATEREMELLMGLHGGIFYISIRRWLYSQTVHSEGSIDNFNPQWVEDRVAGYLLASQALFCSTSTSSTAKPVRRGACK